MIAVVRERHPRASKKDIVRAAFYALTSAVDGDVERAQRLHDFALSHRAEDEPEPLPVKRRKKHIRKDARHRHEHAAQGA
ncbi:hypothetical protein CTI14_04040 [Methylobacterium radiotolerans]|nr:hypothetical protein CTI14_04040 [Methylobacterium radiotolerans]